MYSRLCYKDVNCVNNSKRNVLSSPALHRYHRESVSQDGEHRLKKSKFGDTCFPVKYIEVFLTRSCYFVYNPVQLIFVDCNGLSRVSLSTPHCFSLILLRQVNDSCVTVLVIGCSEYSNRFIKSITNNLHF